MNAADYNYPFHDPYLGTITTAVMNGEGDTPGGKREATVPVLPDRNQLPTLEDAASQCRPLSPELSGASDCHSVRHRIQPVLRSRHLFRRSFHEKGFHVPVLPSPMSWNFALAASRSGAPGYVPQDARDLYAAMQKTLEVLKTQHGLRITRVDFMG